MSNEESQVSPTNSDFSIDRCKEEYKRYDQAVGVCAVLKQIFDRNRLTRNIAFGRSIKYLKDDVPIGIEPDILGRCEGDSRFLLEVKWSLPQSKQLLAGEIAKLKKYFNDCTDWPWPTTHPTQHDVVLLCHRDDGQRAADEVQALLVDEPEGYAAFSSRRFAIYDWHIGIDRSGEDMVIIEKRYGELQNKQFDQLVSTSMPIKDLVFGRAELAFVTDDPPEQYVVLTIFNLINNLFWGEPFSGRRQQAATFSLGELHDRLNRLYQKITPDSGLQIQKQWVRHACDQLVRFDYSLRRLTTEECTSSGKNPDENWYEATRRTPPGGKDGLLEFVCKKLAKLRQEDETRQAKEREQHGTQLEKMKRLTDFMPDSGKR